MSSADLFAAATFVSSALRDLARIACELDPAAAADHGRVLAERLDGIDAYARRRGPEPGSRWDLGPR